MLDEERQRFSHPDVELGPIVSPAPSIMVLPPPENDDPVPPPPPPPPPPPHPRA